MSKRADELEGLFDDLARALRKRIADPECSPAIYSAAVKFLQNNEITSVLTEDSAFADLAKAMEERKEVLQ